MSKPKKGIKFLQDNDLIGKTAADVARFFHTDERLDVVGVDPLYCVDVCTTCACFCLCVCGMYVCVWYVCVCVCVVCMCVVCVHVYVCVCVCVCCLTCFIEWFTIYYTQYNDILYIHGVIMYCFFVASSDLHVADGGVRLHGDTYMLSSTSVNYTVIVYYLLTTIITY